MDDQRYEEIGGVFEQMDEHHPTHDHWYLPLMGVEPVAQGRRLGTTLLQHTLDKCDRDGFPAYLEATSPRNRNLYARHGFDALRSSRPETHRRFGRCSESLTRQWRDLSRP